jgi:hypothetical protein
MGFLRISSHPRGLGAAISDCERLLEKFHEEIRPEFVAADISCRRLRAANSDSVTDTYLAHLADQHGMKLATFDKAIVHPAAELIK